MVVEAVEEMVTGEIVGKIDEAYDLKKQIENKQLEFNQLSDQIKEFVVETLLEDQKGSINVTARTVTAQVQNRNDSVKVEDENIPKIEKLLGEYFGMFFDKQLRGFDFGLKSGVSMEDVYEALPKNKRDELMGRAPVVKCTPKTSLATMLPLVEQAIGKRKVKSLGELITVRKGSVALKFVAK